MTGALDALEAARAARTTPWLFGERLTHADVLTATMLRFITEALPGAFEMSAWPALSAHAARAEALPVFQAHCQPYKLALPD